MDIDIQNIKLVIWDLDDTFWDGTLTEGGIKPIQRNIDLIKKLTNKGIINSICSKNNFEEAKSKLIELGVWDYFVFSSINWEPKGIRIADLIQNMSLRDVNVLFIDDNNINLEEARYYSSGIMAGLPEEMIDILVSQLPFIKKNDMTHSRLSQYKTIEKKLTDKKKISSNEEFLFNSDIKIQISSDCLENVERIHELLLRSNQLNFTKKRSSKEELIYLLSDKDVTSAYIKVSDKYGDYGLIGFYACKNHQLIHFVFSCRTMGMGIEQYVFSYLDYPKLEVIGDVVGEVKHIPLPEWIKLSSDLKEEIIDNQRCQSRFLFKGPCDVRQILSFIKSSAAIDNEQTYINEQTGVVMESYNHSYHVVQSKKISPESKKNVITELSFADDRFYESNIFSSDYKIVFYSLFTDPNLGIYTRKETEEKFAFGEWIYDLTDEKNWKNYIEKNIYTANYKFSTNDLQVIKNNYQYEGQITSDKVAENVEYIRNNMPKDTLLVLILGSEIPYDNNKQLAYNDRHLFHQEINKRMRELKARLGNIQLIEFTNYVKSQENYLGNINHFTKSVYYEASKDLIAIIEKHANTTLEQKSKLYLLYSMGRKKFVSLIIKLRLGRYLMNKLKR